MLPTRRNVPASSRSLERPGRSASGSGDDASKLKRGLCRRVCGCCCCSKFGLLALVVTALVLGGALFLRTNHSLDVVLGEDPAIAEAAKKAEVAAETQHQFLVAQMNAASKKSEREVKSAKREAKKAQGLLEQCMSQQETSAAEAESARAAAQKAQNEVSNLKAELETVKQKASEPCDAEADPEIVDKLASLERAKAESDAKIAELEQELARVREQRVDALKSLSALLEQKEKLASEEEKVAAELAGEESLLGSSDTATDVDAVVGSGLDSREAAVGDAANEDGIIARNDSAPRASRGQEGNAGDEQPKAAAQESDAADAQDENTVPDAGGAGEVAAETNAKNGSPVGSDAAAESIDVESASGSEAVGDDSSGEVNAAQEAVVEVAEEADSVSRHDDM
eukprot:INCI13956.1.p2 GENE.INCI13956.1~~INCI13956.1.p2  ORF type:complete len:398 (-),score=116.41 INCI13956.1:65-1258(-)